VDWWIGDWWTGDWWIGGLVIGGLVIGDWLGSVQKSVLGGLISKHRILFD